MSQIKTLNGVQYTLPQYSDTGWGANTGNVLTQYLAAIADVTLQLSGGSFTLTAETDFGSNFGLKALYLKSETANPASAGVLRLAKTDAVKWRNNANGADIALAIDGSDNLQYNATKVLLSGAVVNADINAAAAIAYSKLNLTGSIVNADINASAAIAYSKLNLSGSIVNADINASAAIALSKLATLTTGKALQSNASTGLIEASSVTTTELGYVSGVTSSIQTQLNATISNPLSANLNANSHKITSIADATASADVPGFHQLKVLQVVSATSSTRATTTGSSFTASNLSASITPSSSSSKILIFATFVVTVSNIGFAGDFTIARGGSNLGGSNGMVSFGGAGTATGSLEVPCAIVYLDSPSSTSAQTYAIYFRNESGSITVGVGGGSNDVQSIILMEVNGL